MTRRKSLISAMPKATLPPAPLRLSHRRTFQTCLMAQDEVALCDRLVAKFPAVRFLRVDDAYQVWEHGAPCPAVAVYRSLQDVPGTSVEVLAVALQPDWRPDWRYSEGDEMCERGWHIGNIPWPRLKLGRSYIAQAKPRDQEPRFNAPPMIADYLQSRELRIHWRPDDPESKRTAMSMLSVFSGVTTQEVQVTSWSRPFKWTEICDRVRYGRHALAWSIAAPARLLGFYGRIVALPRGVDPKAFGFDDTKWNWLNRGDWD